jgi:hypothetical protein
MKTNYENEDDLVCTGHKRAEYSKPHCPEGRPAKCQNNYDCKENANPISITINKYSSQEIKTSANFL